MISLEKFAPASYSRCTSPASSISPVSQTVCIFFGSSPSDFNVNRILLDSISTLSIFFSSVIFINVPQSVSLICELLAIGTATRFRRNRRTIATIQKVINGFFGSFTSSIMSHFCCGKLSQRCNNSKYRFRKEPDGPLRSQNRYGKLH